MHEMFDAPDDPVPPLDALARADDPASSHEAAERMTRSGEARRNAEAVLAVLRLHPGATGRELSAAAEMPAGLDVHEVRRRLPDLKRLGRATNGATRVCAVAGTKALTWWPAG